jgi:DNA (cytosine-5)-methyltransferase 1
VKVLNLYAGIGGNRLLWKDIDVTAVEIDKDIADVYADLFPNDKVVVADAHEYLINNMNDFDFIWSSPPCPSHSRMRYYTGFLANRKYARVKPIYPDLKLYEEVILLDKWFDGEYVVENTLPYYEPLIQGRVMAKHIWWSNVEFPDFSIKTRGHMGTVESLQKLKGINLDKYKIKDKRKLLRNCVEPSVALHIFKNTRGYQNKSNGGVDVGEFSDTQP